MDTILSTLHGLVWGPVTILWILGIGLVLTVRLGVPQVRYLPRAFRLFFAPPKRINGTSPFRALCTALAATVGTGNLVGVAGAICLGGPGAIFWMWVSGFLGMATKYAEATLAVRYRKATPEGYVGGPMYVITQGLEPKFVPLAKLYCVLGLLASFGVGNATQISAIVSGVETVAGLRGLRLGPWGTLALGVILALVIGALLLGGAGRIGAVAETLVPVLSAGYILLCLGSLIANASQIPGAMAAIVRGAFCPRAVTGGALGSAFLALRTGCSRGVFTNEAGMGTASIAHAGAEVICPAQQGLMGVMEVFLDTMVICTLTALVILTSGIPIPYGVDAGMELTCAAFSAVYGGAATLFLSLALSCFAFATVLGWSLYGARCAQFLFGDSAWKGYAYAQSAVVVLGACLPSGRLWLGAEILNGLMALPNLLALGLLIPEIAALTEHYRTCLRRHLPGKPGILGPYKGRRGNHETKHT